jgi:3-hydroxyisobutyrate dehydrogenase
MSQDTVAVLGTGTMGGPMARNLARAGISVRAWNRSRDKAEPLAEDGVQVCGTPAEAADGAGVILTMLADTDAVLAAVVALAAKDAALVAEAAERHQVDVPLTRLLRDRLAEGARDHGDKDMAATYLTSAP